LAVGLFVLLGLTFATAAPAAAVEKCDVDTNGPNDEPGQKDLTKMCVDNAGLPASLHVKWQWDQISWSGANTGDACSLFDTDGDGNANYSLCTTVSGGAPLGVSYQMYSCADTRPDRCNGTPVSTTSTCAASVQGSSSAPVDPFTSGTDFPRDTVGTCTVNLADFGTSTVQLIDVCSYPSQQPNSDPSDCVLYRDRSGRLEVRKALSPATDPGLFNLLIDSAIGASAVGNGGTTGEKIVDSGSHTVGETASGPTNLADYTTGIQCRDLNGTGAFVASGASAGPLTVNVPDGSDVVCVVTNTRQTGTLQVIKTVNWNGITPDGSQTFQICVTGPSFLTPNCKTAGANGGALTWTNVLPGLYNVAEIDPGSAWTVTASAGATTVPANGAGSVTITNSRKLGSLQVTKVVDWNGVTPDLAKTFQICITGPSHAAPSCQAAPYNGGALTWDNLLPGSYTIAETDPGAPWAVTISTSPVTVPLDGGTAAATVANTHKRGSLTVTKVVDWQGISPDSAQTFDICITGPSYPSGNCQEIDYAGGALSWSNLLPGAYVVSETDPGTLWTTAISGSPAAVLAGSGGAAASVTNTRKLGSLQVTKTVNWNGVTPDPAQSFQVCITGPSYPAGDCQTAPSSGGTLTWNSLLPGSYSIAETDPGSMWSVQLPSDPVTVPAGGGTATAAVLNTHKLGNLQVQKIVDWNGSTPDGTQTFALCITGPSHPTPNCQTIGAAGGLLTWSNLLPGDYVVSEAPLPAEWSTTLAGSPVTVVADGSAAAATVTNTRKRGSLTVTKVVAWNGITPDPSTTFQVCISGPSYPAGNCQVVDADGGALTWTGLIPGAYTVSEAVLGSEWSVTIDDEQVTVPNDGSGAAASIVNERKLGSIDLTKLVAWNGVSPDENEVFELCIRGFSYPGGDCKTVGFNGGAASWTGLIPGDYEVYESDPGPEWSVTVDSPGVSVPVNGGSAAASITNTRKRGSLTVGKVVDWNGITPDPGKTFELCITGPSYPGGNCQLAGYSGATLQWNELLPGSYVVSETEPGSEWQVEIAGSPAVVPADGNGTAATVTNSRKLGNLQVTKTVNWNGVAADANQGFTICIVGPSHPNADCKSIGSTGGTLAWTGLIPGAYSVSENSPGSAWDITISGSPATVPPDGGQAAAAVTNSRKLGSLQVMKTVNWNGIAVDTAKTFQICIAGPSYPDGNCQAADHDGGILAWPGLIPGEYTVSESAPGDEWQVEIAGSPAAVPAAGGEAEASVTNTRKLGSLRVTKTVNWNGIAPDTTRTFQVCISGPSYLAGNCQTADHDGSVLTWTGLIPGAYAVAETDPGAQWQVEIDGALAMVPLDGGTAEAGVTNTRKRGSLTVTKIVAWNGVPVDPAQGFQVCISGPSYPNGNCKPVGANGGALAWTNLLPGPYVVNEADPGVAWNIAINDSLAVVPETGGGGSATVTNSRKLGSLQVNKSVDWNGVPPDSDQLFQICIAGPTYPQGDCRTVGYQGGQATWSDLVPGSYTVTETNPGSEWTATVSGSPTVVPIDGGQAVAAVSNTRKLGGLEVTKTVDWNGVPADTGQTFTLCISGPSHPQGDCKQASYKGDVLAWTDLIPGLYTVTETDPGSEWLVTQSATSVEVPADGGTAAAGVTNARKRGSLTVTKLVNWNGVPQDSSEEFEICISGPSYPDGDCRTVGPNGGTLSWLDLLPGAYALVETFPGVEWTVTVDSAVVTVPADGSGVAASVVNTRKLGSLEVAKIVEWNGVPVDNQAAFVICIAGPSYPSGDCKPLGFGGGVLWWDNLIPGAYTVTETDPGSEWTVQIGGSPATVSADGGSAKADVTNSRKLGSLQVTKSANWNGIAVDAGQEFVVCIAGPSYPSGDCRTVGSNGGIQQWTGLIPGSYAVGERDPGGAWAVQISGAPATVPPDGGQAEATVANSRKLGSLEVTKSVDWNGVTQDPAKTFQVCITGPSYPGGDCRETGYSGGVFTWNDLIPGSYTVAETNPGEEWAVQVSGAPAAVPVTGEQVTAVVANTRKLGSLQVTKAVTWNGVAPDTGKSFQICITGPSHPDGHCQTADFDGGVLNWTELIPGNYTVAESAPGSEWQVEIAGSPAAVPLDGGAVAAAVTNSRKLGSLQVTKTVKWNGVPMEEGQTFRICIAGPSYPDGDCQEVGANGAVLNWGNLVPGEYTVAESDPGATWAVAIAGSPAIVPADGGEAAATVTNTRRHGSLTVTKTVDWAGVPVDELQTFEVCINGPSFPAGDCQKIGPMGGVLNWDDLLPGAYAVSESDPGSAWTVALTGSPAVVPPDGTGASAAVANTRKLGSLQVTKTVNWNGVPANAAETFQLCITGPSHPSGDCRTAGPDGGALTWDGLIPGQYAVTESNPGSAWTVAVTGTPATVPIDGGRAAASVTNTRKLGALQVTKIVDWNGVPPVTATSFQICIQGPSYPAANCQAAGDAGGVLTWQNLIPGIYAVTETDPGRQWLVSQTSATVSVPPDGRTVAAAVTNTRKLGGLTVSKVVNWNGIAVDEGQTFQVCIEGPSFPAGDCRTLGPNGGAANWLELLPGVYRVFEPAPGVQWSVAVDPTTVTVPEDGGSVAASVLNTRRLGSLEVIKVVEWSGAPVDNQQTFQLCVRGPSYPDGDCRPLGFGGGALVWEGLLPGVYTVSEAAPGRNWTVRIDSSPTTVAVDGSRARVTVTNTKLPPASITVTKIVSETETHNWSFVLRLNGANARTVTKDQPTVTWRNLEPNQDYVLSEDNTGASWVEGPFDCSVDGVPLGESLEDGDLRVTLTPGAVVLCRKQNEELSGTDEEPIDEPGGIYDLYLPAVAR
jgi:uncharacterized surface anchored protein